MSVDVHSSDYRFGDWIVETRLHRIRRGDAVVHLEPRSMSVLRHLLARAGTVVTGDALLDAVWEGRVVGPNALQRHIALLRRALADDPRAPAYIETITKVGYRAIAPVSPVMSDAPGEPPVPPHSRCTGNAWDTRILVAPFVNRFPDGEQDYFVQGLTEAVVAGLAGFSDMTVVPPSVLPASERGDLLALRDRTGVHYVLEGSVGGARGSVRVTTCLIDVANSQVLWTSTLQYPLEEGRELNIQDDVRARVAAGVADSFGVISSKAYERARLKGTEEIEPREAVILAKAHEGNPRLHREARAALEKTVATHPDYANAWAWLGGMYRDEFVFWINERPEPLKRAEEAAHKALQLDACNQEALLVLTDVRFYQGDLEAFRSTAERALSLNPNSPDLLSVVASHLTHAGFHDEAEPLAQRAVDLTLQPTLHMLGTLSLCLYGNGDYAGAESVMQRVWSSIDRSRITGMQAYYLALLVAASAQLGRTEQARDTLSCVLTSVPDYARIMGPSWHRQGACQALRDHLEHGLALAGLHIEKPRNRYE